MGFYKPGMITAGALAGGAGLAAYGAYGAYNALNPQDPNAQYDGDRMRQYQGMTEDGQHKQGKSPVDQNMMDNMYEGGAARSINDVYKEQLETGANYQERGGRFQRDIRRDEANQEYYQQLGMQNNRQGFQREMQGQELQARQANQLLDGYLQRIQGNQQFVGNLLNSAYN